jgi:hypothetical protein
MNRPNRSILLADAEDRLHDVLVTLTQVAHAAQDDRDSAATLSVLATIFRNSVARYCEEVSLQACDAFGLDPENVIHNSFGLTIQPDAPNETPEDLESWLKTIGIRRSFGPIGVVDLESVL